MATEKRPIDANEALWRLRMLKESKIDDPFFGGKKQTIWELALNCAISRVADCPTVEVAEVVQRWMVMGMTEREKLVQLLMNIPQVNHAEAQIHGMQYVFECAADYLIANGVRLETNQATSEENKRWIPVTERLPEQGQEVIVYDGGVLKPKVYCYLFWDKNFDNWARVTHWMPLPEPPKEAE